MKQWKFIITSTYASIPQMFQNAQVRVSKWYICQLGLFRHDTHVHPHLCLTSGTRVPLEDWRSGKHTLIQQNHLDGVDQYPTPSTAASPKRWDGMRPVTLCHRTQSEGGMLGQRARHALLGSGSGDPTSRPPRGALMSSTQWRSCTPQSPVSRHAKGITDTTQATSGGADQQVDRTWHRDMMEHNQPDALARRHVVLPTSLLGCHPQGARHLFFKIVAEPTELHK